MITKDNFPEIHSTPDRFRTWLIRGIFIIVFGPLVLLLYTIPIAFYADGTVSGEGTIAFSVLYYPFMIWISVLVFRHIQRSRRDSPVHIRVNKEGIVYDKVNGSVEVLRYKDLDASYNRVIVFDVFAKKIGRYGPTVLWVFYGGWERSVRFHTDVGYSYYPGNVRELRSHFIRGISLFRPDLRVASHVYSDFFINPETFEFDKKDYWKTMILVGVFIILIFLAIEWYMQHRFGASPIFDLFRN